MSNTPTYFIMRYTEGGGFVAYATGTNIRAISSFHLCRIVRMYPIPSLDLTSRLCTLQRRWRHLRACRRWFAHPYRLHYRQIYGRFPLRLPLLPLLLPLRRPNPQTAVLP
jgi:hypothetical protein